MPTGLFDEFVRSGLSKGVAMHESMWTTVGWSASDEAHRFAIELELAKAATPKRARLNLTRMCTFSHRSLRMQMAT